MIWFAEESQGEAYGNGLGVLQIGVITNALPNSRAEPDRFIRYPWQLNEYEKSRKINYCTNLADKASATAIYPPQDWQRGPDIQTRYLH